MFDIPPTNPVKGNEANQFAEVGGVNDVEVKKKVTSPKILRRLAALFEFKTPLKTGIKIGLGLTAWIVFFAGWHLFATAEGVNTTLLPGPIAVGTSLVELFTERDFALDVMQSVKRILVSFSIAILIALPLGIFMGSIHPGRIVFKCSGLSFPLSPRPVLCPTPPDVAGNR